MRTFLYLHGAHLESARSFYSGVLGLRETYFSAEKATIGYQVGTLQITIARHAEASHIDGWARQLGWSGGSTSAPSWGIELASREFRRAVAAARDVGTDSLKAKPQWVGYWSFPVRDPMGNTVEISTPDRDAWPPSS